MILKGSYKTVSLAYGNHYDEVIKSFLSARWSVKNIQNTDYKIGNTTMYITFEAGSDSEDVRLDLPNAHIL